MKHNYGFSHLSLLGLMDGMANFAPETLPTSTTPEKKEEEKKEEEDPEKEKEEEDDEPTDPKERKAYWEKKIKDAASTAATDAAKTARDETLAQIKKDKEADDRRKRQAEATAANNQAELLKIEREQLDADKAENDKKLKDAQKLSDDATKLSIATKYKLDADDAARLLGSTKEEWEADAQKLAKKRPQHQIADTEIDSRNNKGSRSQQKQAASEALTPIMGMI